MCAILTALLLAAGAGVILAARAAWREMNTLDAHGDPIDKDEQP